MSGSCVIVLGLGRGAAENPLPGHLERGHLEDHAQGFHNKDTPHEYQDQFLLDEYGAHCDGSSKGQRTCVTHKHPCRMAIEPQKPQARSKQATKEDRDLTRVRYVWHL